MWNDDDRPTPKPVITLPRVLESLSVEGLEEYSVLLEAEIFRTRAEITKRGSAKSAAEAVFGKKA